MRNRPQSLSLKRFQKKNLLFWQLWEVDLFLERVSMEQVRGKKIAVCDAARNVGLRPPDCAGACRRAAACSRACQCYRLKPRRRQAVLCLRFMRRMRQA